MLQEGSWCLTGCKKKKKGLWIIRKIVSGGERRVGKAHGFNIKCLSKLVRVDSLIALPVLGCLGALDNF